MSRLDMSISVSALKKSYQDREVLKDVNFSVSSGTIYALLGSNGAGKTTTIRILTTQIKADSGEMKVEGYDVQKMNFRKSCQIYSIILQPYIPVN